MKDESFVKGLTDILQKQNVIKASEAESLQKNFKGSNKPNFNDFLLDEGLVDRGDLLNALAQYYQVPAFDAIGYFFNHALVRMFPKEFLSSNGIIPIERDENMLIMVASNPNDQELLPRIGNYVSYGIRFRVGIRQDIYDAIEEFYEKSLTEVGDDEDLDDDRLAREQGIQQEKDVEELAHEDFERKE